MENKLAFFVGCTTPARVGAYELSTRRVAEALGVELVDLNFACCGTTYMDSIDRKSA
ncbi:MAG: heterodisulfide reductase-related iron-sulfur binding cluster, partial [Candidatus Thorarchaeota archaeon]